MAIYRLQGKAEKRSGIYYEFDPSEEPLGEGGMGKVYKGRCVNEVTGTAFDVAIKFMFSDLPAHAIERARREASIQIRHDNLVEMLGFIDIEEKGPLGDIQHHYHVVSELLDGIMLDDLLAGKLTNKRGEPMPFAQKLYNDYQRDPYHFATYIIRNVLSGLMALHDAGYIHRDIDPTNIMITSNGHIKLIDFGIAKQMQSLTTNDKSLTVAGVFMGKPEYAAPELILGDIKSQDKTTDIYAVGILLFQCIIGHPPFEGDRHEVMNKQLHQKMPLGLIKNKQIRKIIETATDKTRAKRFRSAAEFRVALDQIALNGTGGGFEWKPLYTYIISGVAACGVIAVCTMLAVSALSGEKEQNIEEKPYVFVPDEVKAMEDENLTAQADTVAPEVAPAPVPEPAPVTFGSAIAALHRAATASEGFAQLESLSKDGNADATYLVSRLYFKSKLKDDYCPDSITRMQKMLKIGVDNRKAHRLLEISIEQNPRNYQALYELACDYWKGAQRTEAVQKRDADKAIDCFCKAMDHARRANDRQYIRMITGYRADIVKWLDNVKDISEYRSQLPKWKRQVEKMK
ncbi:serine/threonine protein kinase [Prevotella communis]|uniref:Serine/threonine protein kinase n=1 Tax=Prevotella communis TaxID=2913614 RepID=A0A1G7XB29_9BACT|nr:serine/threonine-protein kinase [Prevotella communis]SDG81303.1 serine/threonine protein kinase [Prevotella communis]